MLYILVGPDDFSLREKLKELKEGWGDLESLAINTTLLEAKQLTMKQLIDACNTVPFLGQRRLVVVEGLLTRFEPRGTERQTRGDWQEWQALGDYVGEMPYTTEMVLVDGRAIQHRPGNERRP